MMFPAVDRLLSRQDKTVQVEFDVMPALGRLDEEKTDISLCYEKSCQASIEKDVKIKHDQIGLVP
jgi:hypothetical protein